MNKVKKVKKSNQQPNPTLPSIRPPVACTHFFNTDSHNVATCSRCGEVRQYPWDKGQPVVVLKKGHPSISQVSKDGTMATDRATRRRYYRQHRGEITADLLSIGREATSKKWNIPPGAAIHSLAQRLLTPQQRAAMPRKHRATTAPTSTSQCHPISAGSLVMPAFPEFNHKWPQATQVAWFRTYAKIKATNPTPHPGHEKVTRQP